MFITLQSEQFDFRNAVLSHGWVFLAPFQWDDKKSILVRPLQLASGRKLALHISARTTSRRTGIVIEHPGNQGLSQKEESALRVAVERMLRLKERLEGFHSSCRDSNDLKIVGLKKWGRMLRGPSAFEDLIKTICTTNCGWRNTKTMCEALCQINGGFFPQPEDILNLSEHTLRKRVPVGYRASTILNIAEMQEANRLPLDDLASEKKFDEIRRLLGSIKGCGRYSINHMLVLLGCYDSIPVDSEVLAYLREQYFGGKHISERQAVMPYNHFGEYKYLAYKFSRIVRRLNYINC